MKSIVFSADDKERIERLGRGIIAGLNVAAVDGDHDGHIINAMAQQLADALDIAIDNGAIGPTQIQDAINHFRDHFAHLLPTRLQ
jgi:hypothetical protein